MKQTKISIIAFLCIVLITFNACSLGGGSGSVASTDYRKGTDALKMEFMNNAPPEKVGEDSHFDVAIELKNDGGFDIAKGILTIGYEKDYLELLEWAESDSISPASTPNSVYFNLIGKSLINDEGGFDVVVPKMKARFLEPLAETHTTILFITSCYSYNTSFDDTVCIDTDPYNRRLIDKVCESKAKSYSSQGAPVAVTKIEPDFLSSGDRGILIPKYTIHLKNKGIGEIINSQKLKQFCSSSSVDREDVNRLDIEAYLSGRELKCSPEPLRLEKNKDKVICKLEEGIPKSEATYLAPIVIILKYGYTHSVSKPVEIRRGI